MGNVLRFAKIAPDAVLPIRKHPTDAGVDVYALEGYVVEPHTFCIVHTGLTFEVGYGQMLLAKPKSGSNFLLGAGVIDTGYQGEVMVKVVNVLAEPITISKGQAVAQLVQVRIFADPLEEWESSQILHAEVTDRGADGGIAREVRESSG